MPMTVEVIEQVPFDRFICDENIRDRLNLDLVEQIAQSFITVGQLQPVRVPPVTSWIWSMGTTVMPPDCERSGRRSPPGSQIGN